MIVSNYQASTPTTDLLSWVDIPKSSFYYKPSDGKRGARPSTFTIKQDGSFIENIVVIEEIKEILSQEFCCYGYHNVTAELRDKDYVINDKKVYRLMDEHNLLLGKVIRSSGKRQFVRHRKIEATRPMEYLCLDIKYVWVIGEYKNYYLLTVLDVFTRVAIERLVKESQPDIIFIEASGLADPISIGSLLDDNKYFYLSKVVTIVDAVTFSSIYKYIKSVTNQVRVADIVLVNKFDKITSDQAELISNTISVINPLAQVFFTCFGRGDFDPEIILKSELSERVIPIEANSEDGLTLAPLADISSRVYKSTNKTDKDKLLQFVRNVPSQIIRLKGFITCADGNSYLIQFVKGDKEAKLTNCENVTRTEVIAIGTDIPEIELFK